MGEHLDAMFYSVFSEEDSKQVQPRGQLKEFDFRDPGDLLTWYMKSRHETALRNKRIPEYPTYPRPASGAVGGLYRFELLVGEYFVLHHEAMGRCVLRFEYDTHCVVDFLRWFRAVPRYVVTPRVKEDLIDVLRSWVVVSELTAELRKET